MGGAPTDFSDSATVRELAGKHERLVCLELSIEGTVHCLYCHSFPLSFSSSVLRNVLEDTQQEQGQLCTIPLTGDTDINAWQLALGLMYRQQAARITLENAQALLLLAHKYDMQHITAEVGKFLSAPSGKGSSMLLTDLSPSTANGWLQAVSRCGLEQQVQACITFIVDKGLPVTMELLSSLDAAHADKLLAAQAAKYASQEQTVKKLASDQEASVRQHYVNQQTIFSLKDKVQDLEDKVRGLKDGVRRSAAAVDKAISTAGGSRLYKYQCSLRHQVLLPELIRAPSLGREVPVCPHCNHTMTRTSTEVDLAGLKPPGA